MAETPVRLPLALGTMRMLEVERSKAEWIDFLSEVHRLGIDALHSSFEYDSFPLLSSLLHSGNARGLLPVFRHIAKLAEPGFDDVRFDAVRLEDKVKAYCLALTTPVLHDVQWMWRQGLNEDQHRTAQFESQLDEIGNAVGRLKRAGLIERFFCFPYSPEFGRIAIEHVAIDGLIVYRNVQETDFDRLIDRCFELSKPCHIIRPFNAGAAMTTGTRKATEHLAFALDKPAIESAILSSNSIEHLQQLAAAVRDWP